jgi:cytochrome c oxidase subunit 2
MMKQLNLSSRNVITLSVIGVLLLIGGFILTGAIPYIFPPEASAESQQIDSLFRILLVIGGAIFFLVQGLLAYSVWKFRAKPGDMGDGEAVHGNTTLEIVWTAVPAVIVFILTILSYQVFVSIQSPKQNEMVIKVQGARFNWAFTVEAPSKKDPSKIWDIQSADLHTYVNRPVLLNMKPVDVIHGFWVPAFRLKQDLLPGRETQVRFTPIEAGTYPLRCTVLCGGNHSLMTTSVIVYASETEYNTWLDSEVEKKDNPPADPVLRGRAILESKVYPCYTCHAESDLGWTGNIGPSLNGVGDRAAAVRGTVTGQTAEEYLYTSVHNPSAYLVPGYGNLMPNLNLDECTARPIVAYLCTLTSSGTPACKVTLPAECGVGGPAAESTAEATAEATASVKIEATVEVTAGAVAEATAAPAPTSTPVSQ